MAQQTVEAISVRLSDLHRQSQTQLDGFMLRPLRVEVETQRHLYATEWCTLGMVNAAVVAILMLGDELIPLENRAAWCCAPAGAKLHDHEWIAVVAATVAQRASFSHLPLFALEVVLTLVQSQAITGPVVWLLTFGHTNGASNATEWVVGLGALSTRRVLASDSARRLDWARNSRVRRICH